MSKRAKLWRNLRPLLDTNDKYLFSKECIINVLTTDKAARIRLIVNKLNV